MPRPNPIQYAERLYAAIRAGNFSPISFLAFGNAVKDGLALRQMPRTAAEPFMRVVGEMMNLDDESIDGTVLAPAIHAESESPTELGGRPLVAPPSAVPLLPSQRRHGVIWKRRPQAAGRPNQTDPAKATT